MRFKVGQKITVQRVGEEPTYETSIVYVSEGHEAIVTEDRKGVDSFRVFENEEATYLVAVNGTTYRLLKIE